MTESPHPQRMGRILRLATEEVLGEEGLRRVLDTGNDSSNGSREGCLHSGISQYMESLEQAYGEQAGRGLALRVGRACFPYGLREYGETLGLTQASFRLLPFPKKLKKFSAALSILLQQSRGLLTMEEADGKLLWHMDGCPLCEERHTRAPACHLAVGLTEESMYWLSGGKIFQVEETACIAQGDSKCTLQVDPAPLS